MIWINYFFTFNIPFYIYKLKSGDSIIHKSQYSKSHTIIILHGIVYLVQVFSNNETIPISIMSKNNILDINNYKISSKSYYKVTALKDTYLLNFCSKKVKESNHKYYILKYLLKSYQLTLYNQENIRYILCHKTTKYRIIQLIIILSLQFGIIEKNLIKIPFKVKKTDISLITGSNISNVNKIVKILEINNIIKYSNSKLYLNKNKLIINLIQLLN
uniref:Global nitrogen transcriptional regulator n=1 Tax=Centroceras clavulatum TaxID=159503 RepID=A0A4D6WRU2_9FLOR|nr:global nitrogen transcriptional regulator [Centroceras clavulatum]